MGSEQDNIFLYFSNRLILTFLCFYFYEISPYRQFAPMSFAQYNLFFKINLIFRHFVTINFYFYKFYLTDILPLSHLPSHFFFFFKFLIFFKRFLPRLTFPPSAGVLSMITPPQKGETPKGTMAFYRLKIMMILTIFAVD